MTANHVTANHVTAVQLSGAALIARERIRQVTEEGWTAEHDRGHHAELIDAARCYASETRTVLRGFAPSLPADTPALWPWASSYWKPTGDPVRDLTKAGALIAAAIDSLLERMR